MEETKGSLQLTLDPVYLILSQYSDPLNTHNSLLQFTTDSHLMERGPRYYAYAQLRELKLRSNRAKFEEFDPYSDIPRSESTPAKNSVKFQENSIDSNKKRRSSVLAQSVGDFSPVLRKENRRPPENRIPRAEKSGTPPSGTAKREKVCVSGTKMGGGSRSVNSGEKQSGGRLMMMGRKSYASIDELKGLSIAASNAINGENRVGKRSNVLRKSTVFSTRYY
uniref:Uncharacterized protein n=1 Tax=Opuntia streptacantha TaxID=393608 RepID=A0A7C8ZYK4_OPUST